MLENFSRRNRLCPAILIMRLSDNKVGDEIEYVASRLESEDNTKFQALLDLMGDMEFISGYSEFAYGLRTGIQLMMELFFNGDHPLFRERDHR